MEILIKKILRKIGFNKLLHWLGLNRILFGGTAFHRDRMMRKMVLEIIKFFPITTFVETGTYWGGGVYFIAKNSPFLSIFSCEVKREYFEIASRFLKKFPQVQLFNQNSEDFLYHLNKTQTGELPLFYLDAHGHGFDYLPLPQEIKIINSKYNKAIIIIDDFQVPEREDFAFLKEGDLVCNFELIKPFLNPPNSYQILYPNYSQKESGTLTLIGYGIIFKNLDFQFSEFVKKPFILKNFKRYENRD